ncbi:hypothetical protein GURKE_02960 [Brevundimonas phage vB_BpoS-Gurke]|uniref:Uncharacterized protein n=1 Tax=Brevundimonas phage vB_BpoS-Gurke TaxID=2948599 RepID=A0A9E7STG6_9CAUD|nr:hypothetical protein GURKE_02960 [Brevundimonas phage vB_BpoS-Gurke]
MTVVGIPNAAYESTLVIRTQGAHYAQAVQHLLDETAFDLMDDLDDDEANDPQAQAEVERDAFHRACDHYKTISVYAGHPPAGSDDVSKLVKIHEE